MRLMTCKKLCNRIWSLVTCLLMTALAMAMLTAGPASAGIYDTENWGKKFRYGAFSTLISSHVLGIHFRHVIETVSDPEADFPSLTDAIEEYRGFYEGLDDEDVSRIIAYARTDETLSIYEEERSIVSTTVQNDAFIQGMAYHAELRPVDSLIEDNSFRSDNFQFSAHRGLYNNAYGIPQNSLASIVNAYVAGIRNIEFDVLTTHDGTSVLIHDLVTNRLNGAYDRLAVFVENMSFDQVKDTAVDVLNPLGDEAETESTGVTMMTTARVLEVVVALMPELTLYIDARNDAPLAIIRLLHEHPEYRDNVVLKIYPFSLNGGLTDVVERYANLYHDGDQQAAAQEIADVNPHTLLALGHVEMEAGEGVTATGIMDFDRDAFQGFMGALPFSRTSGQGFDFFNGNQVFDNEELEEIESRTFLSFRWAMGLTGITNTLVFQMGALPSLKEIIRQNDVDEYGLMSADPEKRFKISAAVHDNIIALYNLVKSETLSPVINLPGDVTVDLFDRIAHVKFGISDRFPDFTIARRVADSNDIVDQEGMANFNYSMLGNAGPNHGYQAEKVRSTASIMARINELELITGTKVVYATTDLATDLRMAFMGLLGENGLPEDLKHRASGIIKERYELDPGTFQLPEWVTQIRRQ